VASFSIPQNTTHPNHQMAFEEFSSMLAEYIYMNTEEIMMEE
jgi:hypothetical protein